MLEVSPFGVKAVLRLERDAWSMIERLRQATNEYAASLRLTVALTRRLGTALRTGMLSMQDTKEPFPFVR